MIAGRPVDLEVPEAASSLIGHRPFEIVWRNEAGGLTFRVDAQDGAVTFVKWAPASSGIDFAPEIARLTWARSWTEVPEVIDAGRDADGQWMQTRALAGRNAVDGRWLSEPATAVTAIGQGLRAFHDRLPVQQCPFSWSVEARVADARHRASTGTLDARRWSIEHPELSLGDALRTAATPPPVDQLVVCHGDACAPNTLIDDNGRCCGHVDLGGVGVADRWADLAIATWSTTWNYGPGWERPLLKAYGVEPDDERTSYYRLLWGLDP